MHYATLISVIRRYLLAVKWLAGLNIDETCLFIISFLYPTDYHSKKNAVFLIVVFCASRCYSHKYSVLISNRNIGTCSGSIMRGSLGIYSYCLDSSDFPEHEALESHRNMYGFYRS
jgi:hypothetical protein